MLKTIKKEMAVSFLRHYVKLYMLKNKVSSEAEALEEISKKLPILAFSDNATEKIGAKFIAKNKWLFVEETLYPNNGTEITDFDALFNIPPDTVEGHAAVETCTFVNIFHTGSKLSDLCSKNEVGLEDNVFRLFPKKIQWDSIKEKKFSSDFLEENIEKVNWHNICRNQALEETFMRKYADKLIWDLISRYQKNLSEDFMDYFKEKLNWLHLCEHQIISEQFMKDHKDLIRWSEASKYQVMSLEFIEEMKDYVDWDRIGQHKVLPTPFIEKYYNVINKSSVLCSQNLEESFIKNHYHEWSSYTRRYVFSHQGVSKEFCDEHKNDITSRTNRGGATWSDLFENDRLLAFDFKGTLVHKNVPADQIESTLSRHKGPIMVKAQNSPFYFRSVFVRNKNAYRLVKTDNGYKNWRKQTTPIGDALYALDEVVAAITKTIVLPAPEKTEE